jgi:hypothetical protein
MNSFYDVTSGGMDLSSLKNRLTSVYKRRLGELPKDEEKIIGSLPVALIYGRPECPAMKNEIIPALKYLNARSGNLFEIALMGYNHKGNCGTDTDTPEGWAEVLYDAEHFSNSVKDLETSTTWKYSGQTDFVFVMSSLHMEMWNNQFIAPEVKLDFSLSVSLCLETAISNKLIPSASWLLEEVTRAADPGLPHGVVDAVSQALVARSAKAGFVKWIAGLLKIDTDSLRNVGSGIAIDVRRKS